MKNNKENIRVFKNIRLKSTALSIDFGITGNIVLINKRLVLIAEK